MNKDMVRVAQVISKLEARCLGKEFTIRATEDKIYQLPGKGGRIYLQVEYSSVCVKTGKEERWAGRKWYLSEFMTKDEIVKTAFAAFKAAIEHEILEGFRLNGKILFNPHVDSDRLVRWNIPEVRRRQKR